MRKKRKRPHISLSMKKWIILRRWSGFLEILSRGVFRLRLLLSLQILVLISVHVAMWRSDSFFWSSVQYSIVCINGRFLFFLFIPVPVDGLLGGLQRVCCFGQSAVVLPWDPLLSSLLQGRSGSCKPHGFWETGSLGAQHMEILSL